MDAVAPANAIVPRAAIFNGMPKGKNWFYRLFLRGQGGGETGVRSWNYPSWGSPLLWTRKDAEGVLSQMPRFPSPRQLEEAQRRCAEMALAGETPVIPEEIERAKQDMPEQLFRGVEACVQGEMQDPQPGSAYVMGVDLAKQHDYSVIVVADAGSRAVVHFDRFSHLDWPVQKARIIETSRRYNNAIAYIDATGLGDPIVDDVRAADVPIHGVKFSAEKKRDLVNRLSINIEQRRISYPRIEQLLNELEAYAYAGASGGAMKTSAPSGFYDDSVMALALCVSGLDALGSGERLSPEKYSRFM